MKPRYLLRVSCGSRTTANRTIVNQTR